MFSRYLIQINRIAVTLLKMGTKWENIVIWTKNGLRRLLTFTIIFVALWNCSKVPYYIGFDPNGDRSCEKGGLTLSINLCCWVAEFTNFKLLSPAFNFLLVHIAFVKPVLVMMVLSLINNTWRKNMVFTILPLQFYLECRLSQPRGQ